MPAPFFDPNPLRAQFPALALTHNDFPMIFLDNPGGTQVPNRVIEAVSDYYRTSNANVFSAFATSQRTDTILAGARQAMADLLNAPEPETIVFGANMTTLTFHLARSFAETIQPGDEIVVTSLDHDANVTPWTDLQAGGATIKVADVNTEDCTLNMDSLRDALTERTRLVAITYASNAVGTISDIAAITKLAHQVGAVVYVDAVQYAPHGPIDVQALECDFLVCSAYKFFGPHVGILYGNRAHLERLTPHKVRPAKNTIPHRWETGTLNHEGIASVGAAVAYLESIGELYGGAWREEYAQAEYAGRRLTLKTAMRAIKEVEKSLSERLIAGLQALDGVTLYGITDPARFDERVPTVALTWHTPPRALAEHLAAHGICCYSGNYYALRLMERLGLEPNGGALRLGLAHYNTETEIDRVLNVLRKIGDA